MKGDAAYILRGLYIKSKGGENMKQKVLIIMGCLLAISIFSIHGYADEGKDNFKVTITNMTSG